MLIFKRASDLQRHLHHERERGKQIGFVPTMGALHPGHLSLVQRSATENALTVCSIFINPTQFTNHSDFQHYPVTIEKDLELLLESQCDVLFLPPVQEVYPPGHIKKHYDLGTIETVLEGAFRPGHFQGVCEVVDCLLQLTKPHVLYLGQKDFQQCLVVQRLLQLTGCSLKLRIGATLRQKDGLAMSSRNLRLQPADRLTATAIYKCLQQIKADLYKMPLNDLEQRARKELETAGFNVDYVAVRRQADLQPPAGEKEPLVALAAATINGIRLIDNLLLN